MCAPPRPSRLRDMHTTSVASTLITPADARYDELRRGFDLSLDFRPAAIAVPEIVEDVGVAGYSLGGGMGWLARKHGLQTNSVTAIELVTASGLKVRCDAENHADLFFALRGGGGNFGVVTAIEFRLYEVSDIYAGWLI